MSVQVPPADARRGSLFGDTWVVAKRGLQHIRRQPEALSDVSCCSPTSSAGRSTCRAAATASS